MPKNPALSATVKITCKDINNNSVAKMFNAVGSLSFDYDKGTVNIVDDSGSFYFPLIPSTTLTYTITGGLAGQHAVVIS